MVPDTEKPPHGEAAIKAVTDWQISGNRQRVSEMNSSCDWLTNFLIPSLQLRTAPSSAAVIEITELSLLASHSTANLIIVDEERTVKTCIKEKADTVSGSLRPIW